MKKLILSLLLLGSITAHAQEYGSWQKRDTTKKSSPKVLPKSTTTEILPSKSEMKILPATPKSAVKPESKKEAVITIYKNSRSEKQEGQTTISIVNSPNETLPPGNNEKAIYIGGANRFKINIDRPTSRHKFQGHWTGLYYGFVNTTTPDYSAYPPGTKEFMDFDWAGSFALQFNLIKYSISLSRRDNFGLVTGLGFDYQRLRFADKHQSVTMIDGRISPLDLESLGIEGIKRSTFKTLYLTIPLLMEVQLPARNKRSNSLYISGGVVGGIRMHSKTKVVYNDDGKHKRKEKDSFNMIPFKADATIRLGFHSVAVWGNYTLTNMFKSTKGPEMHPYTIGIGFTV